MSASAVTHGTGHEESRDARPDGPDATRARAAELIAVAEDLAGEFALRPLLQRILRRCTELLGCEAANCSVDEAAGSYRKEADIGAKLASANAIVDELLEAVVSDLPFGQGDDVALMINRLGGTPISELYLLYGYAHEQLTKRGINVRRNYVGEYCTSLDMAGTSITLSRLDDEITGLLAAPAEIAIRTF